MLLEEGEEPALKKVPRGTGNPALFRNAFASYSSIRKSGVKGQVARVKVRKKKTFSLSLTLAT